MNINDALNNDCFRVDAKPSSKQDVLRAITYLAKKSPVLKDISEVDLLEGLVQRESISSTGFLKGVAIPHCRIAGLENFVLGLLMVPEGVDFDSFDGEPSKYFFFILAPEEEREVHIQILSTLSLAMKEDVNLAKLDSCANGKELFETVSSFLNGKEASGKEPSCLFNVIVQADSVRPELLKLLSQVTSGQMAVINDTLVQAVINKSLVNDTIRRIDLLKEQHSLENGLLVTVHELLYQGGNLSY